MPPRKNLVYKRTHPKRKDPFHFGEIPSTSVMAFDNTRGYFTLLTLKPQNKVTIVIHISFQLSYNKAQKDPYNPIRIIES
jgi:hypothetical protein